MKIYLVRHTTPEVEKGVCYGQTDLEVADSYHGERDEIVKIVENSDDTVIYTSLLKRCYLLAKYMALPTQELEACSELMELDFGSWELIPWSDIPEREMRIWSGDFVNEIVPDGESYKEMYQRVEKFYKSLDPQRDYILVTHSGVIRCILSLLLDIPLKKSFDIVIDYGSVIKIQTLEDGHNQIQFLRT